MAARISSASTVDEAVEILERDGVVALPGLLTAEQLEAAQRDLLPLMERTPNGKDPYFAGTSTRRAGALFAKTRALDPVATHPLVLETAKRILCTPTQMWAGEYRAEETSTLQIGATQCIQIHPGQGLQPLHRDDAIFHHSHPGPEVQLGVMITISDFTEDNGATRIIPGSNTWDDERMPQIKETVPAEAKAGSVVIWLGSTYHGGGQNVSTDSVRTGVVLGISKGYLRQEENHYLAIPKETIAQMPAQIQELLGYAPSSPYMGWIEYDGEMADPRVVLGQIDNAGLRTGETV